MDTPSHISHTARYRQIAGVLMRHGLDYLIDAFGLGRFVPFHRHLAEHSPSGKPDTKPEHLRLVFQELGTTFIKLGQVLSTRGDLLGPAYQAELAKLQDHAPPVAFADVEAVIVAELGKPIDELFATFDPAAIAAASIGQAHAARMSWSKCRSIWRFSIIWPSRRVGT
jgi:ubiquinone biosynthesis protein